MCGGGAGRCATEWVETHAHTPLTHTPLTHSLTHSHTHAHIHTHARPPQPENILLKSPHSGDIKLIDFGSACFENRTVYSYIQSRFYRCACVHACVRAVGLPTTLQCPPDS